MNRNCKQLQFVVNMWHFSIFKCQSHGTNTYQELLKLSCKCYDVLRSTPVPRMAYQHVTYAYEHVLMYTYLQLLRRTNACADRQTDGQRGVRKSAILEWTHAGKSRNTWEDHIISIVSHIERDRAICALNLLTLRTLSHEKDDRYSPDRLFSHV